MDDIVKAMGIERISKFQLSAMANELDALVEEISHIRCSRCAPVPAEVGALIRVSGPSRAGRRAEWSPVGVTLASEAASYDCRVAVEKVSSDVRSVVGPLRQFAGQYAPGRTARRSAGIRSPLMVRCHSRRLGWRVTGGGQDGVARDHELKAHQPWRREMSGIDMGGEPSAEVPLVGGLDGKLEAGSDTERPAHGVYRACERADAGVDLVRRQRNPNHGPPAGVAS